MGIVRDLLSAIRALRDMGGNIEALSTEVRGVQEGVREGTQVLTSTLTGVLDECIARVVELESKVDLLPQTWEEINNKARRTEERTRASVRRITDRLEASGIYDDEAAGLADDLLGGNAAGSGESGMSAMPEGVGHPFNGSGPASAEPMDWETRTLMAKYGRR